MRSSFRAWRKFRQFFLLYEALETCVKKAATRGVDFPLLNLVMTVYLRETRRGHTLVCAVQFIRACLAGAFRGGAIDLALPKFSVAYVRIQAAIVGAGLAARMTGRGVTEAHEQQKQHKGDTSCWAQPISQK
jgi:hypothetical protein